MIITVTFSPSIDYVMDVENLRLGEINRSSKEVSMPGGKGINVSKGLRALGVDSLATGILLSNDEDGVARFLEETYGA